MSNNTKSTTIEDVQKGEQIEEIISPNVKKDEEEARLQAEVAPKEEKKQQQKEEKEQKMKQEQTEVKESEEDDKEDKKKEGPKKDYAPLMAQALIFKQEGNKLFSDKNYSEVCAPSSPLSDSTSSLSPLFPLFSHLFFVSGNRPVYTSNQHSGRGTRGVPTRLFDLLWEQGRMLCLFR